MSTKILKTTDTNKEGTTQEQRVQDDDVAGLLNGILKELKIMNIHLSMMTDNEITRSDIDA